MQVLWGFGIVLLLGLAAGAAAKLLAGGRLSWTRALVLGVVGALAGEVIGTVAGNRVLAAYPIQFTPLTFWVASLLVVGIPALGLPLTVGFVARRRTIAAG
jgi:hypothetical protein